MFYVYSCNIFWNGSLLQKRSRAAFLKWNVALLLYLNCEEAKVFLPWLPLFCCGGPKGIWTLGLCDANAALSQLSYGPLKIMLLSYYFAGIFATVFCIFLWSGWKNGADGGTWTLTIARQILSLVRLPIPPRPQINHSGVFKMEHRCEIFLKRGSGI